MNTIKKMANGKGKHWTLLYSPITISLCIMLYLITTVPTLAYSNTGDFISFVDKFAQKPFILDERINGGYFYFFSSTELRTLRNTVLARHGYIFDSQDLVAFFSSRKWYKPVSKEIELSDLDKQNIDFILRYENQAQAKFTDYLALFQKKTLPIKILLDENYNVNDHSKFIPFYFSRFMNLYSKEGYPGIECCPEVSALDKIFINDKFIIMLTHVLRSIEYIYLTTYSLDGRVISEKIIARSGGDSSVSVSSKVIIEEDLNIDVETKKYKPEYDDKIDDLKDVLVSKTSERFHIDSQGHIQKLRKR